MLIADCWYFCMEQKTQLAAIVETSANTVRITFLPEGRTVEFEPGKLVYQDHGKPGSLLDVALNHQIALEHAGGGNCACTTCHVHVLKGAELLSEMDDDEAD